MPYALMEAEGLIDYIKGYSQLFTWSGAQVLLLNGAMDTPWGSMTVDYAGRPPELFLAAGKIKIPAAAVGRWTMGGAITASVAVGMQVRFTVTDDAGQAVTEGRFPAVAPLQSVATESTLLSSLPDIVKTRTDTAYTINVNVKALAAATVNSMYLSIRKFL